jgi:hypothetical protein
MKSSRCTAEIAENAEENGQDQSVCFFGALGVLGGE